jgi:hypothetical protein
MKGTPIEVNSLMHSILQPDLIQKIDDKVYDIIKTDLIMESIGATFINWISYVCNQCQLTLDNFTYEKSIWNQHIPANFQKLAEDITFIIKDLSITSIDTNNYIIIFIFKNKYIIHLSINNSPIHNFTYNCDESTLLITTSYINND